MATEEMTIREDAEGVPWCGEEKCGSFDGKRCKLMGHAPEGVCVPYVQLMSSTLTKALAIVTVTRAEQDMLRMLCTRAELTGGQIESREILAILNTAEGTPPSGVIQ